MNDDTQNPEPENSYAIWSDMARQAFAAASIAMSAVDLSSLDLVPADLSCLDLVPVDLFEDWSPI